MDSLLQRSSRRLVLWTGLALALAAVFGCGHKRNTAQLPAPQAAPPVAQPAYPTQPTHRTQPSASGGRIPITPLPTGGVSPDDLEYIATHRPILSEEGDATWYTAPYKGRKAANGEVFSDAALTAAHRTLPMGSLIVVTNLATNLSSAMRISDRGPFVPDKIIDPKPIDSGGRWCVQIGAFTSERRAEKLKEQLLRRYPDARVIEFPGEDSYWVRIRPEGDNREQAEWIARQLHPSEGDAYLTRLD
jgi:rare lipoprotein A